MKLSVKKIGSGTYQVNGHPRFKAVFRSHSRGNWGIAYRTHEGGQGALGQQLGDEDSAYSYTDALRKASVALWNNP